MSNVPVFISIYNFPLVPIPKHTLHYRKQLPPSSGETTPVEKVLVDVSDIYDTCNTTVKNIYIKITVL
jgi:hypothetical protein